jgi:hypothetical protein
MVLTNNRHSHTPKQQDTPRPNQRKENTPLTKHEKAPTSHMPAFDNEHISISTPHTQPKRAPPPPLSERKVPRRQACTHFGRRFLLRPSLPSDEELAAQSWMKKRTKLRTLAAQPTPPNAFCKTRVPTKRLAPWLLCSLPTWRFTQRWSHTHFLHACTVVGKPKPQLQGMVHPTTLTPVHTGGCADALTCESVDSPSICPLLCTKLFRLGTRRTSTQTIHPPPLATPSCHDAAKRESALTRNVLTYTHTLRIRGVKPYEGLGAGATAHTRLVT